MSFMNGRPEFGEPEIESEYKISIARRSADSIALLSKRLVTVLCFGVFSFAVLNALGRLDGNSRVMIVFLAFLAPTVYLLGRTAASEKFISDPGFAEITVSVVVGIAGSGSIFSIVSEAYGNGSFLVCDDQASNLAVPDGKKARIEVYSSLLGALLPFMGLILMHLNVVHYKVLRRTMFFLAGCHALRTLVLTPVEAPVMWIIINYVIFLPPILMSAKSKELSNRKLFLLERQLTSDLKAAEKALRYEAPTSAERQLVQRVVKDDNATLRDLELSFESLELFETLGGGAFGEVIKGKYAGTMVAVKRLRRSQMNEECLRMLLMEASLLRDMRHPNIVQLVGVSWDSAANVCVVLEYMERGSLRQVLASKQIPLSWSDPMLKMLIGVTSGLLYMHTRPKPVIHRDIKPDNVLVTSTYGCKLTDLGASRRVEHLDSATMTQVGTDMYIAPEVIVGQRYDMSVDIYAVGIMLVAMHTRKKPFPRRGMTGEVLNGLRPTIPEDMSVDLSSLALDCWQHDPELRPGCAEVLARLKRVEEEDRVGILQDVSASQESNL